MPQDPDPTANSLQRAALLLQRGGHDEAMALMNAVIAAEPNNGDALNLLGIALAQRQDFAGAVDALRRATRANPQHAGAFLNYGNALRRSGRLPEAVEALRQAMTLRPDSPARRVLASILLELRRFDEAVELCTHILQASPSDPVALADRGLAYLALDQTRLALADFGAALAIDPTNWDAIMGTGAGHLASGDFRAAVEAYNRAAPLRPEDARAYLGRARAARGLGNQRAALYDLDLALKYDSDNVDALTLRAAIRRELNQRTEALADCDRALAVEPANWSVHNNRGVILDEMGRPEEALRCFERSLELNPNNPDAFQNMGTALLALGRGEEAIAKYDATLARDAANIDILNAKGAVLVAMRRFEAALASFDQAVAIAPQSAISNFQRAFALLALGRYPEGFEAYEWRRLGERPFVFLPRFAQPELAPGQEVRGKTLLLYSEQGMGDVIQFARFARVFADKGAKVVVATYPALVRVLSTLGSDIEVVPPQGPMPAFDLTCPIMSVPLKLGLTLETLPVQTPYLSPLPSLVDAWRGRSGALPGLRVGLAWSGNPQYANDWTRSIAFEKLSAIMDVAGVTFVDIQRDLRSSDESAFASAPIVDFRTMLMDFAETAALVSELDVVVTVDTSLAHLAGAMGKPVWVLLSAVSDWRWLQHRSDSPWYPTARLFRQQTLGDWAPVFAEVKAALSELAARKR